jgi:hypothetical protein
MIPAHDRKNDKGWVTPEETKRMAQKPISINRAPVLTLWAALVAQRLGFEEDEALTLGKALAGLNAQAKGRRLAIFKPHEGKAKKVREKEQGERFWIESLGRPVPATNTDDGIRAVNGAQVNDPDGVPQHEPPVTASRRPSVSQLDAFDLPAHLQQAPAGVGPSS